MKALVQKLYDELLEDLAGYAERGVIPIPKLNEALRITRSALTKLKEQVLQETFANQQAEIDFFKKQKPLFVAEQLYAVDLCMIQAAKPSYDNALIRTFLEAELRQLMAYFHKYYFLYQYYQFGSTDLDHVFFIRGIGPKDLLLPDNADPDPEFSTACDHVWARFIANERLKEWLVDELRLLDGSVTAQQQAANSLKWTGNSVNLAELAYGIWLTGQVNNGNVSVSEIVIWLEQHLQVRIGDPHRRWQSIAARKRAGPFVYVDEVKAALVERLEEEWRR